MTLNLDLNTIRSTFRSVQNNENSQITVLIGQNTRIKLNYLDLFNIKSPVFCDVFNGNLKDGFKEDVWHKMTDVQKNNLKKLLSTGVGHGYQVIHKLSSQIKSIKIDKKYMEAAATPTSCEVFYGGKTGNGKRIDIEIVTKKYKFKLNIRDTQGAGGYPTRLMGDFTYL